MSLERIKTFEELVPTATCMLDVSIGITCSMPLSRALCQTPAKQTPAVWRLSVSGRRHDNLRGTHKTQLYSAQLEVGNSVV